MTRRALAALSCCLVAAAAGCSDNPDSVPSTAATETSSVLDPAVAEAAFFEFTDVVYPDAGTAQLIAAAEATCDALRAGETKTVVLRVMGESDTVHSERILEKLFVLSVAYRCPEFTEN